MLITTEFEEGGPDTLETLATEEKQRDRWQICEWRKLGINSLERTRHLRLGLDRLDISKLAKNVGAYLVIYTKEYDDWLLIWAVSADQGKLLDCGKKK